MQTLGYDQSSAFNMVLCGTSLLETSAGYLCSHYRWPCSSLILCIFNHAVELNGSAGHKPASYATASNPDVMHCCFCIVASATMQPSKRARNGATAI